MSARRKRWIFWSGLTCFLLGAVVLPLVLWWIFSAPMRTAAPGATVMTSTFIDLNNGMSFGGNTVWLVTLWMGANVGGVVGLLLGFGVTKFTKI